MKDPIDKIPGNTLDRLETIITGIIEKFEKETDCKIMIGYGVEHGEQTDSMISMSENLDFGSACKLSVSIKGCIERCFRKLANDDKT